MVMTNRMIDIILIFIEIRPTSFLMVSIFQVVCSLKTFRIAGENILCENTKLKII